MSGARRTAASRAAGGYTGGQEDARTWIRTARTYQTDAQGRRTAGGPRPSREYAASCSRTLHGSRRQSPSAATSADGRRGRTRGAGSPAVEPHSLRLQVLGRARTSAASHVRVPRALPRAHRRAPPEPAAQQVARQRSVREASAPTAVEVGVDRASLPGGRRRARDGRPSSIVRHCRTPDCGEAAARADRDAACTRRVSRPPAPRPAARPRAPAGRSPRGGCGGWRPPRAGTCARGWSRPRARRCRAPAAPARSPC